MQDDIMDRRSVEQYHGGRILSNKFAKSDVFYPPEADSAQIGKSIISPSPNLWENIRCHSVEPKYLRRVEMNLQDRVPFIGAGLGFLGSQLYLVGDTYNGVVHRHIGPVNGDINSPVYLLQLISDSHETNIKIAKQIGLDLEAKVTQ